jgi:hypothetical protein
MNPHRLRTLSVCLFFYGIAFAQLNTTSLTGLIKDASDAVILDATVTAPQPGDGDRKNRSVELERLLHPGQSPCGKL